MRVVFLLPGHGGSGGAHSVVQESVGLQRLGVAVAIATTASSIAKFNVNYPELEQNRVPVYPFADTKELSDLLSAHDIACATTWESVHVLADAVALLGKNVQTRTAYYVQDYEPLFCLPGSKEWIGARRSYTLLPEVSAFAKTRFLCDLVYANHNKVVHKVSPSIDHATFFPSTRGNSSKVVISAMLRPRTRRRAPRRTARIVEMLSDRYGDSVELITFGCQSTELGERGIRLSERIDHRGVLNRRDVAGVLRASDLFLDLSDYQAFGRTGLEGMACGCVPVLPIFGGASEYLKHWVNGFLVDTRSDEEIIGAASDYVALTQTARERLRFAAIETAIGYTIEKASFSECAIFRGILGRA